jgi:hypothetical protein
MSETFNFFFFFKKKKKKNWPQVSLGKPSFTLKSQSLSRALFFFFFFCGFVVKVMG